MILDLMAAVTRGHKITITKWFRIFGNGPVFPAELQS